VGVVMRIGRLEFGFWKYLKESEKMIDPPFFRYREAPCGCILIDIEFLFVCWLGKECYDNIKEGK
jgi:hypothetical protein